MSANTVAVTPAAAINSYTPCCLPHETYDSVMSLLVDAQALLNLDRASACYSLSRALTLLQRSDAPVTDSFGCLRDWEAKRLITYIDTHLHAPIRTLQLAAVLNLSHGHFSHAFKNTFGVTPLIYVAQRRIESARRLMLTTDYSLTDIAHRHGFCDQSHFIRTFRRQFGVTPHVWRRQRRVQT